MNYDGQILRDNTQPKRLLILDANPPNNTLKPDHYKHQKTDYSTNYNIKFSINNLQVKSSYFSRQNRMLEYFFK